MNPILFLYVLALISAISTGLGVNQLRFGRDKNTGWYLIILGLLGITTTLLIGINL